MCGIAGKVYTDHNRSVSREDITRMTDAIAHRGPDGEGVFLDKNLGLGHRRLSIIDLSERGRQPMADETGRYQLVFNGEIYNFQDLRKELEREGVKFRSNTDSEVIIYLYRKYGPECLQHLRGMFAFAIWDAHERELFIARDRLGKKPLKYYFDGSVFIFASELKAILTQSEVRREIDWGAIDEYLTYLYVPCPKTGFMNISKLEPAHYMIVKDGQITKKRYWQLSYLPKLKLTEQEWKERILAKLRESVKLRLISDVPLGAHLSGGIDSSLVVALMAEQMGEAVKTFSIGFPEASHNDLAYAKSVSRQYATEHHEFTVEPEMMFDVLPEIVRQFEEPYADTSALPTHFLCKLTRSQVTVVLDGNGSDEEFAGYSRYGLMRRYLTLRKMDYLARLLRKPMATFCRLSDHGRIRTAGKMLEWYSSQPAEFYTNTFSMFSAPERKKLLADRITSDTSSSREYSLLESVFGRYANSDPVEQAMGVDVETYLPDDTLVKSDMASMLFALEVRSPFLDHELAELVAQMPTQLKVKPGCRKYLLKEIAETYLPKEIVHRDKRGFGVPFNKWLNRMKFSERIEEQLLSPDFIKYGFDEAVVRRLLQSHRRKATDYAQRIWSLLMLRLWLKEWFEK